LQNCACGIFLIGHVVLRGPRAVNNSYPAGRLVADHGAVPAARLDLIAVKPVETNPGAWDDIPNPAITLWGLYASNVRWSPRLMTDVYFLDYDAKSATYDNQSAREHRRMVGARYFNRLPDEAPRAGFDYNVESGFQWGTFGNRSIRAWGAGGNFGWTLPGPESGFGGAAEVPGTGLPEIVRGGMVHGGLAAAHRTEAHKMPLRLPALAASGPYA
jgi:Alginate export